MYCVKNIRITWQTVIILSMIVQIKSEKGIACFKCSLERQFRNNQLIHPCSQFDGSAKYQTYCPSSTLCMKRTIYYKLPNGTTISTVAQRDCALQKYKAQEYDQDTRSWVSREQVITTAYTEGCFIGDDNRGAPGGPPEYCYCSFHLCNSAVSIAADDVFVALTMMSLFVTLMLR